MKLMDRVLAIVEGVRSEFAPDPRTALFEVGIDQEGPSLVLMGATSEPAAAEELHRRIAVLDGDVRVRDALVRLPLPEASDRAHAVVRAASAPMLAGPLVSEPHVSQTVLGHRLLVLREHGRWLHCRSDDGYLGWVHRGYVRRMDETAARAWEVGAEGEVCISLGAQLLDESGEVLARLPWGARFHRVDDGTAVLPTGERGRVEGEVLRAADRPLRFPSTGEAVVDTALGWIGAPYQWGGITPAGVDCSGLAQTVYRLHGVALPRDSDQQAARGDAVDPGDDFAALRPGDLLFFAETPARISHVALSLGGSRIVHSALGNGGVRRNDLLGDSAFESELRSLLVAVRRLISPADAAAARSGADAG